MQAKKKALILTYYWPPSGGAGVQRWLKTAKYFPRYGVEPYVVTVDPDQVEYPVVDASLSADVPEQVRVYRTDCSNPYGLYKRFTGRKQAPYGGFANEGRPSLRQKIARFVRGNFLLPDARRGWNRYAFRQAARLIRQEQIATVITTGPPMSTHLIGLRLKRNFPIHWVADFRDPWTDLYYQDMLYPTWPARKINAAMERRVLLQADQVWAATPEVKELLLRKSARLDPARFTVITNGYDASDVQFEVERDSVFTLVYTGTLASVYPLATLLSVIRSLRDTVPLRFKLVGKADAEWADRIREVCGDQAVFIPYLPHRDAIAEIKKSAVALLVIPQAAGYQGALPGKFFEYLGAGTPVLCLCSPQSEAKRILAECGAGAGFGYADAEGMTRFLKEQYQQFVSGQPTVFPEAVTRYERSRIAGHAAALLPGQ